MEMLLLSEERECGKMKKKKIMFIILCMLTVLAAGTAHATEKAVSYTHLTLPTN